MWQLELLRSNKSTAPGTQLWNISLHLFKMAGTAPESSIAHYIASSEIGRRALPPKLTQASTVRRIAVMQLELGVPRPLDYSSEEKAGSLVESDVSLSSLSRPQASSRLVVVLCHTALNWIGLDISEAQALLQRCSQVCGNNRVCRSAPF